MTDDRRQTTDDRRWPHMLGRGPWSVVCRLHLALVPVLLFAFSLRLPALFANTFHADEALFASWARLIAVWRDPLLTTQAVDKPPLLFYLGAIFYPLFGPVEWAARMPDFIASLLLVPLLALLAWNLTRDRLAAFASALLLALAPLAVQFSATVFTDPLLAFWLVAAAALVARRGDSGPLRPFRPALAGLCFGLAAATKYQAWLFLPLLAGLGWLAGWDRRAWGRAALGFLPAAATVLLWSAARSGPSAVIGAQFGNIGGLRLAWPWELVPRLAAWARLWGLALGPGLGVAIGSALAVATLGLWKSRRDGGGSTAAKSRRSDAVGDAGGPMGGAVDLLLALFVFAYVLLHWLWAAPVWDRYLLPVFPFALFLLGRLLSLAARALAPESRTPAGPAPQPPAGSSAGWDRRHPAGSLRAGRLAAAAILLAVLVLGLPGAWAARSGSFPIGGSPVADAGVARAAALLEGAPYGTVLYDHWASWQWRYQLFDKTVYVSWFPHPAALLDDLAVFGTGDAPRYIVLPDTAEALPVRRALAGAGYRLAPVGEAGSAPGNMVLYKLEKGEAE